MNTVKGEPTGRPIQPPHTSGEALVTMERVSRTFGTGHRAVVAVHAASCVVEPGARLAIVGPSGSGKSTLLHLMAGLDGPTSGSVDWPLLPEDSADRAGAIAMVFQGASLMPPLTVLENVAFPLLLQGRSDHHARVTAAAALASLAIGDLAAKLPEELSGGQAQRVSVARAVALKPMLILADEPTGQLDSAAADLVVSVLVAAADEVGAGLVVSTHDPIIAARLSDQWQMHEGRLETTPAAAPARNAQDSENRS